MIYGSKYVSAAFVWSAVVFGFTQGVLLAQEQLPKNLKWLTNEADPVFANQDAPKGGTLRSVLLSFPPSLRVVGPDSNSGFRSYILSNQMGLVNRHPNTDKLVREIATTWAYGDDKRSMYFKIDPQARWSDGKPVTADDFVYTLEYMRSPMIVAPWYNDFYTKEIEKVVKYDEHTIGVFSTRPHPDLDMYLSLSPTPKHFYHPLGTDYVQKYNWAIVPNTGPYQISKVEKGKSIVFDRKKDWWAKDFKYYKGRFNADKVVFNVVRDENAAWEYFRRGEIDAFALTIPSFWYDKAKGSPFDEGYVEKIWFYNNVPQPPWGLYLNLTDPLLADKNIRLALAHSMNFDKVNATVTRGDYARLDHAYVGYGAYSNPSIKARDFDLKKVDEYLKKAGWGERGSDGVRTKDSKRLSFEITYGSNLHTDRLVVLREEAKKAGIELQLKLVDATQAFKSAIEKKTQISWMAWSGSQRPTYWESYHSDNANKPQTNNVCNLADPDLDKMIDKHRALTEEADLIKLGHQIQAKIADNACFVPALRVPFFRAGVWRWVRFPKVVGQKISDELLDPMGSDPNSGGLMVGSVFWIDESMKKDTEQARKEGRKFSPVLIKDTTYKQ